MLSRLSERGCRLEDYLHPKWWIDKRTNYEGDFELDLVYKERTWQFLGRYDRVNIRSLSRRMGSWFYQRILLRIDFHNLLEDFNTVNSISVSENCYAIRTCCFFFAVGVNFELNNKIFSSVNSRIFLSKAHYYFLLLFPCLTLYDFP